MVQEVDGLHSGVEQPGVFEVADVSLFDDVNDELAGSSLSCFVEAIVSSNGFVDGFHPGTNAFCSILWDIFVIDPRLGGSDKGINVLGHVFGFGVDQANEVMVGMSFVIRDGEEDLGQGLIDPDNVGIRGLSDDLIERQGRLSELGGEFLRLHDSLSAAALCRGKFG